MGAKINPRMEEKETRRMIAAKRRERIMKVKTNQTKISVKEELIGSESRVQGSRQAMNEGAES
jgi:hypothetical protein